MQQVTATFDSAREVIGAERICRAHSIAATVMPLPEHTSSECGMCLKIDACHAEHLKMLLAKANINVTIYEYDR